MNVRIGIVATRIRVACIALIMLSHVGCTTHQPVRMATRPTTDSIALGRARVTMVNGGRIHLTSAFIRGDSIVGTEKVTTTSPSSTAIRAMPLDSVRALEQQKLDVVSTLRWVAAGVLLVGLVQFFNGGAACC